MSFFRQLWRDFKDFWKAQVYWAVIAALLAAGWQYFRGQFSGSISEILVPYIGLVALFLVGNVGRTIVIAERESLRRRRRDALRAEHRLEIEKAKLALHAPNLQFRRVFKTDAFLGHEISGRTYDVIAIEIGNELTDRAVGDARRVRGHITYLDKSSKVLHTICPAHLLTNEAEINLRTGEGTAIVLATDSPPWTSGLRGEVEMKSCARIEVRLLSSEGNLLTNPIALRFKSADYGESPSCTLLPTPSS